jgi:hypothetical protein
MNATQPPGDAGTVEGTARADLSSRWFWLVVLLMATLHYAVGAYGVSTKSATFDEPLHLAGTLSQWYFGDFRVNYEDPPLWKWWAGLAMNGDPLAGVRDTPEWEATGRDIMGQWALVSRWLYQDPQTDVTRTLDLMWRGQLMMGLLSAALVVATAAVTLRAGRDVVQGKWLHIAALTAAALVATDPNVLGHGFILKNDVAISLLFLLTFWVLMELCRAITVFRVIALGVLCGMAASTKFTGVLLAAIVPLVLIVRSAAPRGWTLGRRTLGHIPDRLTAAVILSVVAGVIGCAVIWLAYGLRFHAIPNLRSQQYTLDLQQRVEDLIYFERAKRFAESGGTDTRQLTDGDSLTAVIRFALEYRALPEAWLNGLAFVHSRSQVRETYLNGNYNQIGWWYYFPACLAYKTPTGTLALWMFGIGGLSWMVFRRRAVPWVSLGMGFPAAIYLAVAMRGNLNLGFRHVLPIVVPMIVIAATAVAGLHASSRRRWVGPALAVMLVASLAEVCRAGLGFIAFFNTPTRLIADPIELLGDSNLDWGQDYPALAAWQRTNPDKPLYLAYFSHADPAAYGVRFRSLLNLFGDSRQEPDPNEPAYLAVNASALLGLNDLQFRGLKPWLTSLEPRAILNGTIYLYDWPPATPPPAEVWETVFPRAKE